MGDQWCSAVAFAPVDDAQNPNVRRSGGDPAEPYYRAMTVAFASMRRWNPDLALRLITNVEPPQQHAAAMELLQVAVVEAPFDHRPPRGFYPMFAGSLYQLDAMRAASDTSTLFIDPDILCIRPIDAMLAGPDGEVGVLPLPYPDDEDVNGLTARQAGELHGLLGEPVLAADHYGGECFAVPASESELILERAERAWRLSLERFEQGSTRFTTEEHLLNFALRRVNTRSLEPYVRRIWTTPRHRTVDGHESDLTLWHLPAEKGRGFRALHKFAVDTESWFWAAEPPVWRERAARAMGLSHRSIARWARDTAGRAVAGVGR